MFEHYRIPKTNNVKGKKGRKLIEFVRNLPDPDTKKLQKNVDVYVKKAIEAREVKK